MLQECVGGSSSTTTTQARSCCQLVMKCLWKLIRALPSWLQEGLDVAALLLALHDFLKVKHPHNWNKPSPPPPGLYSVRTWFSVLQWNRLAAGSVTYLDPDLLLHVDSYERILLLSFSLIGFVYKKMFFG